MDVSAINRNSIVLETYSSGAGLEFVITQQLLDLLGNDFALHGLIPRCSKKKTITLNPMHLRDLNPLVSGLGDILLSQKLKRYMINHVDDKPYLIILSIWPRAQYTELSVTVHAEEQATVEKALEVVEKYLAHEKLQASVVSIHWYFEVKDEVRSAEITEIISDTFYSAAYPNIPDMEKYVNEYLESDASVLVLRGSPGLGKTRFIRYLLSAANDRKKRQGHSEFNIGYTADPDVLSHDRLFIDLLDSTIDVVVLEDIDNQMGKRSEGNDVMVKLLNASDGLISSFGKKIILSTNLPHMNAVDEALLRPGRCFDTLEFQELNEDQTLELLKKLTGNENLLKSKLKMTGTKFSLAEVYYGFNQFKAGKTKKIILEKHMPSLLKGNVGFKG